jgi:hypothetical protein
MKKARIILATVAVIGLVGGALAFKAARYSDQTYYTTGQLGALAPAANTIDFALTTASGGRGVYWTITPNAAANRYNLVTVGN